MRGFVYLIYSDTGHYKIGYSKNPRKRKKVFSTEMPVRLSLRHVFPADNMRLAEKKLHERFASMRRKGEWFVLDADAIQYIFSVYSFSSGKFFLYSDRGYSQDEAVILRHAQILQTDVKLSIRDHNYSYPVFDAIDLYHQFYVEVSKGSLITQEEINLRYENAVNSLIDKDVLGRWNTFSLNNWETE